MISCIISEVKSDSTVINRKGILRHGKAFQSRAISPCALAVASLTNAENSTEVSKDMPTWKSRGLRGSALEDMINRTNERYAEAGLALIQKIPTPITPIKMDKESRHITLAYFDQKSTVDYIGAVQGIPVCFDAKECAVDAFSLQNIHDHQVDFMQKFEKQGGVAFFLIYYTHREQFYYLPFEMLYYFWDRKLKGGRKSFRFDELNPEYFIPQKHGIMIPYLDMLQKDLDDRA